MKYPTSAVFTVGKIREYTPWLLVIFFQYNKEWEILIGQHDGGKRGGGRD